jgi:hypothetical protein
MVPAKIWRVGVLMAVLIAGGGCQTFTLSQAKLAEQQQGHYEENLATDLVECGGCLLDFFAPDCWRCPEEW